MTLHPVNQWFVPKETSDVARACFPKGNVYMKMYDSLGVLYSDEDFRDLFPVKCGKSAISPAFISFGDGNAIYGGFDSSTSSRCSTQSY